MSLPLYSARVFDRTIGLLNVPFQGAFFSTIKHGHSAIEWLEHLSEVNTHVDAVAILLKKETGKDRRNTKFAKMAPYHCINSFVLSRL